MKDPIIVDQEALQGWKLLNFFIGSNELCRDCRPEYANMTTPDVFKKYVEKAIERIHEAVPDRTLINLSKLYFFYKKQSASLAHT